MKNTILFLQNAWSPFYAGGEWHRSSWLQALERSRSGQRLKILIDDFGICFNTTPIVGATPSSKVPPDEEYIRKVINWKKPLVIIACGKQAEEALMNLWNGALLAIPHPAHRFLTDELYRVAKSYLAHNFIGRVALRQRNGWVEDVKLGEK